MIVDFHTHIFPPFVVQERARYLQRDAWLGQLYANPRAAMATAETLVAALDQGGVDTAVALNFGWSDAGLCAETNDYLLEAAQRYPGRIVAFCSVQPRAGTAAVREAERCARRGARGLGELMPDGQGFDLADAPALAPLAEAAQALRLPLLTHASEPVGHSYPGKGRTTPDLLFRLIVQFPDLPLVLAHWGGGLPLYGLLKGVKERFANVYFDTAASPFLYRPEMFRHAVEIVGAEHILFGTDYPLLTARRLLQQMQEAALAEEAQELILAGNARRLLAL